MTVCTAERPKGPFKTSSALVYSWNTALHHAYNNDLDGILFLTRPVNAFSVTRNFVSRSWVHNYSHGGVKLSIGFRIVVKSIT